jgi:heat shock protein HslJ
MKPTRGIVALLALALAGCGGSQAKQQTSSPTSVLVDPLAGHTFSAAEATVDGAPRRLLPGAELTFTVHQTLDATGGCNQFGGPVTTSDGRLEIPEGSSQTLMACEGEAEKQDAWLRDLLEAGPDWRLDGDRLVLTDAETELVLTDATMPNPDLAGTAWTLVEAIDAEGRSHPAADPATLRFTEDTVEVDTGCNTGSAGYTATGTTIQLDALTLTRMACQGEAMRVEQTVVEALRDEVRHRIDDQTMRIAHPSGAGLTLARSTR